MNLLQFDSEDAWINSIVSLWRDRLRTNPALRICLPAGNTPNPVYRAMAQAVVAGQVSFQRAEVFALDEFGGLAPDDPGRCENMLRRNFIERIDLPPDRFHAIAVDAEDLEAVCRNYEALIGPGFDLTLLGVGLNGHLGLNEPGSAADSLTRRVDLHSSTIAASAKYLAHEQLPRWGITIGLERLLGSKEIWLLAAGRGKAEIVQRCQLGPITTEVPASLLRQHRNSWLMVDADAGALLWRQA